MNSPAAYQSASVFVATSLRTCGPELAPAKRVVRHSVRLPAIRVLFGRRCGDCRPRREGHACGSRSHGSSGRSKAGRPASGTASHDGGLAERDLRQAQFFEHRDGRARRHPDLQRRGRANARLHGGRGDEQDHAGGRLRPAGSDRACESAERRDRDHDCPWLRRTGVRHSAAQHGRLGSSSVASNRSPRSPAFRSCSFRSWRITAKASRSAQRPSCKSRYPDRSCTCRSSTSAHFLSRVERRWEPLMSPDAPTVMERSRVPIRGQARDRLRVV